jgi:NDP-sugar pyrophosphorylase family protein
VDIDLGVLRIDNKQNVIDYIEKPKLNYNVSMGIYAFNKAIIQYIPKNEYLDFPDLIKKLLKIGKKISSYYFEGYWLDIGRPSDYEVAIEIFEQNKTLFIKNENCHNR